ncbi:MAG: ABC transporter permease [Haloarculaceae archaeon]
MTASQYGFADLGEVITDRVSGAALLLVPVLLFELAVFVVPFFILLRISLTAQAVGQTNVPGTWTLESYLEILGSSTLHHFVAVSFEIGVIATVTTVVLGFAYAYIAWRATGWRKSLMLFSVVVTLLTTLVVKTFVWVPVLSPNGVISNGLQALHLVDDPLHLYPGFTAAIIGQTYVILPYTTLAIYSVLTTIDWSVVEAARDLGASRPRSIYEVVLPSAVPGLAVATVIAFAWNVGSYAAPFLLGSSRTRTMAMEVQSLMLNDFNWSMGSALAIVMMALVLLSVVVLFAALSRWEGGVEFL